MATSGDIKYYKHIAWVLFACFAINAAALLALNAMSIEASLVRTFGTTKAFMLQLYFWGALGATIACSTFMANDKERNEIESIKPIPDPKVLRYPNIVDVLLYVQRVLTSGFLAIFGAAVMFAGLGYFDVPIANLTAKHRIFLIVLSLLIGLFQNRFLSYLTKLSMQIFRGKH